MDNNFLTFRKVRSMDYLSVRELRSAPKNVWGRLKQQGQLVLTNNGKPVALMLEVDGASLQGKIALLEQAEAMQAVNEMQMESARNGNSNMSLDEINQEIAASREGRKKRTQNAPASA
jgi:hypothetical protein